MHEFSGSFQAVGLCSTLWLVPLFPLLAAAVCLFAPRHAPRWSRLAAVLALGLAVAHAVELAALPAARRCLFDHLFNMIRIGSLDAGFALSLDPLSAILIVLVSGAAALAIADAARSPEKTRALAVYDLMLGAMLLLVLADNLVVFLISWHLVALAVYFVVATPHDEQSTAFARSFFVVNRLGDSALLAGSVVLFWTLGGGFGAHGDYIPDYRPPLIGVGATQSKPNTVTPDSSSGVLSMTALPGAQLREGGASVCAVDADGNPGGLGVPDRPCQKSARSPFVRIAVPVAMHDFTVDSGPGEERLTVEHVRIDPGVSTEIMPSGPTFTFRTMRDQLAVLDHDGRPILRQALTAKTIWGLPALSVAFFFFVIAAAARSALWPLHVWLAGIAHVRSSANALIAGPIGLASGAYLLARLGFYAPLAPGMGLLAALLGAFTALICAMAALSAGSLRRALSLFAAGQIGLVFIGLGTGAIAFAVLELAVATLGLSGLWLTASAVERTAKTTTAERDLAFAQLGGLARSLREPARAYYLCALATVAAPFPALGVFWSREALLWRAFESPSALLGALLAAAGVLASLGLSFAVWRSYYLVFSGHAARARKAKRPSPRVGGRYVALGVLALALGLAGVSGAALGMRFASPIAGWLGPLAPGNRGSENLGALLRLASLVISFALPFFGWSQARRRYGSSRPDDWQQREQSLPGHSIMSRAIELSGAHGAKLARSAERAGSALARLDAAVDRFTGQNHEQP